MHHIRDLTATDVPEYKRVRLFALQESPTSFGSNYTRESKFTDSDFAQRITLTADRFVLGAFLNQELIGLVGFLRENSEKVSHKGSLWGVYVVPPQRGQGIARALLTAALQRTATMPGLLHIRAGVIATNQAAISLYEKFGFKTYAEEPDALRINGVSYNEFFMSRSNAAQTATRS